MDINAEMPNVEAINMTWKSIMKKKRRTKRCGLWNTIFFISMTTIDTATTSSSSISISSNRSRSSSSILPSEVCKWMWMVVCICILFSWAFVIGLCVYMCVCPLYAMNVLSSFSKNIWST